MKNRLLATAALLGLCLALLPGCSSVKISPRAPLIAGDLIPYHNKRLAVLAFREPVSQPGLGNSFATCLHREILLGGNFAQASFHPETVWFGLQSSPTQELATAGAMGADLGADLAVVGAVERFVYGRTADSLLEVSVWVMDTVTGEVVYAERIQARGKVKNQPPYWEPGLSKAPERLVIMDRLAAAIVHRMGIRWDKLSGPIP
jgi:hypothetical protein